MKQIERPVHVKGGSEWVTYKGKQFPLQEGNVIDVSPDGPNTVKTSVARDSHKSSTVPTQSGGPLEMPRRPRSDRPTADDWTTEQREVIEAAPTVRLVVEAAPGTGKTAVACARVADLLRQGVGPSNIWLLSFTRTAVQELIDRIRKLAKDDVAVHLVRIATVDSYAWQLRQGFDGTKVKAFSSYDQGIDATLKLLRKPTPDLKEELGTIEHLILDEAQDVVGTRALLVERLIELLPEGAGVTILCDPAQAIYDFTNEDDGGEDDAIAAAEGLVAHLLSADGSRFERTQLEEVIRASSQGLQHIFVETRRRVLEQADNSYAVTLAEVQQHADAKVGLALADNNIAGRRDVLVLFRRRAEVLMAAAHFSSKNVPFRLRMSGYPPALEPWIALVLADWIGPTLNEAEFLNRWTKRVPQTACPGDGGRQWTLMHRYARKNNALVDIKQLREILARSTPPVDFTVPDYGVDGPILGTIHASKGREAEEVHLMLARAAFSELATTRAAEESRVLFVGATRARAVLVIGEAAGGDSKSLKRGRCYRFNSGKFGPGVQTEIGRYGDLDELSLIGRNTVASVKDALGTQHALATWDGAPRQVSIECSKQPSGEYKWIVSDVGAGLYLGRLTEQFNSDLWSILGDPYLDRYGRLTPPRSYQHLLVLGTRSIARAPEDPDLQRAHEPWASSGFWLAPNIWGYSTGYPKKVRANGSA